MKNPRILSLSAGLVAASLLPLIQSGCSKPAAPAPVAATPAPVPVAPAPAPAAPVATPPPAAPVPPTPPPAPAPAAGVGTLDFGDYTSATITGKAWAALGTNNYDQAIAYAQKCIDTFKQQALDQQKALTAPVDPTNKDAVFAQWALNDVGTSYYILGMSLEKQGKNKEAGAAYTFLVENLPFAQCYDPKGWFWKPAEAAKEKVKALEFDSMK